MLEIIGIPQNRERVYTISIRKDIDVGNFKFPDKQELTIRLKDILEKDVDEKYYLSDEIASKFIFDNNKTNETNVVGKLNINKWQDNMKRIYDINTYSPTLNSMQGGQRQPKILIKNATKRGYIEAFEGDSINLVYPNSKTRRGRVGYQVSQTLQCNEGMGVIIQEMRIRRLTPCECWKLMGFDDEDFEKAQKINSNTQLYKQARKQYCSICTRKNISEFI